MKKKYGAKSIAEAALFSAIICIVILFSVYSTALIGSTVVPVLIAILYLRHSKSIGLISVITSGILIFLLSSNIIWAFLGVLYGFVGIVFGVCIHKKLKAKTIILMLSISNIISIIISFTVTSYLVYGETYYEMCKSLADMIKDLISISNRVGIDASNNANIDVLKNLSTEFIMQIIPISVVILSIITAYITYIFARKILNRLNNINIQINELKPFSTWYLDAKYGAVILVLICISLFAVSKGVPYAEYINITLYQVFALMMTVIGFSVFVYFLKNKLKIKNGAIVVISIFLFVSMLVNLLVVLGAVDLLIDIRGVDPLSLGSVIRNKLTNKK